MTTYAFLLKLRDKPGAMESIAATFAHRGISLATILANDADSAPDGLATVLVTFRTSATRKEALKATLGRLTRVASVVERAVEDPTMRQTALVRLTPEAEPAADPRLHVSRLDTDAETGETLWAIFGPHDAVQESVDLLRAASALRAVTFAVVAL